MIKMEFTKKELKEIEKIFDMKAGEIASHHAHLILAFEKIKSPKVQEHLKKVFEEYVNTFDVYRTISAKADKLQNKETHE